ncbi:ABC transporter substrate-binding protein [Kribbella deserti]|uniref:ABC transporter substrate-binding protein n=1 Tax=Kribbella deserti TaxID=1926257 RepID=A0ABV6QHY1_9ACTN
MRHQLRSAVALAGSIALLAVAACSPPQNSGEEGKGGKTVTTSLAAEPVHLNPMGPFAAADTAVLTLLQDTLLVANQQGKYLPRLAESWTISPDAKTFTFRLRPGQVWSDGQPFTAKDVVFTLTSFAHPKVASPQSTRLSNVAGYADLQAGKANTLAGVTAQGADTVQIKLANPDAGFLSLLAAGMYFFILPEHVLGKIEPAKLMKDPWFLKPTVSIGPFTFGELQPDQRVVLNKNPKFRTPVAFDRIILNILKTEVATGQLGTGEIDIAPVGPLERKNVEGLDGVRVESIESPGFNRIALNMRHDYLKDKRVRQALVYGMDRQGAIDAALGGNGKVLNSAFMTEWAKPAGLQEYAYNPDKAKQLLADAKWDPNQVLIAPYDPLQTDRAAVLTVLTENLKKIGVKLQPRPFDPSAGSPLDKGDWDLFLFGGGVYGIDPATLVPILTCEQAYPKGGNIPGYCSAELDKAMSEGARTASQEARAKAYRRAAQIENEDVPYLWTARPMALTGVRDRVQGYVPWGDAALSLIDVAQWKVD